MDPRKQELLASLRTGKNFLRNQNLEKAFAQFKEAFELAQIMGDHFEEKKAARGLGLLLFSCRLLFFDRVELHNEFHFLFQVMIVISCSIICRGQRISLAKMLKVIRT